MINEIEPKSMITLRDTSFEDIPAFREMHAKSWLATYPNEDAGISKEWVSDRVSEWTTPEGLAKSHEHFKDIFGNPNHLHRIAYDGETAVGLVHASRVDGHQYLEALYIDEEYYGTGLAQQFMDEVESWIDNTKPIDLGVVTYNKRAQTFYEKYGYKIKPNSESLFADKIPTIIMEKQGIDL